MISNRHESYQKITVLIPTVNEPTLEKVVRAIRGQAPGIEIMLLGFGEVRQVAEKYGVEFLDFKVKTRKTVALNTALQKVERDWIIVVDADAIPENGWAEKMAEAFESGYRIFSGSVRILTGNFWIRVYNLSLFHEFSIHRPPSVRMHLPALTMGFTKEFYESNGPFLESLNRSEDYEWSLRAYQRGETLHFHPEAVVNHMAINKNSFRSVLRYWYNSGYENWKVRLMYTDQLNTPRLLRSKLFILIFSPLLALKPTLRIFSTSPNLAFTHLPMMPFIYLAKIAWCFGVFFHQER